MLNKLFALFFLMFIPVYSFAAQTNHASNKDAGVIDYTKPENKKYRENLKKNEELSYKENSFILNISVNGFAGSSFIPTGEKEVHHYFDTEQKDWEEDTNYNNTIGFFYGGGIGVNFLLHLRSTLIGISLNLNFLSYEIASKDDKNIPNYRVNFLSFSPYFLVGQIFSNKKSIIFAGLGPFVDFALSAYSIDNAGTRKSIKISDFPTEQNIGLNFKIGFFFISPKNSLSGEISITLSVGLNSFLKDSLFKLDEGKMGSFAVYLNFSFGLNVLKTHPNF